MDEQYGPVLIGYTNISSVMTASKKLLRAGIAHAIIPNNKATAPETKIRVSLDKLASARRVIR